MEKRAAFSQRCGHEDAVTDERGRHRKHGIGGGKPARPLDGAGGSIGAVEVSLGTADEEAAVAKAHEERSRVAGMVGGAVAGGVFEWRTLPEDGAGFLVERDEQGFAAAGRDVDGALVSDQALAEAP